MKVKQRKILFYFTYLDFQNFVIGNVPKHVSCLIITQKIQQKQLHLVEYAIRSVQTFWIQPVTNNNNNTSLLLSHFWATVYFFIQRRHEHWSPCLLRTGWRFQTYNQVSSPCFSFAIISNVQDKLKKVHMDWKGHIWTRNLMHEMWGFNLWATTTFKPVTVPYK